MNRKTILSILLISIAWSCSTESQKGQAVGFVTHFSHSGVIWKSWELELNSSQTGMTSTAHELQLSIDNDHEDTALISRLDSAQNYGWKVQIDYESHFATNCMCNRGDTPDFIQKIIVLDKTPLGGIKDGNNMINRGKAVDTIYVVIKPK